jgi:uncharacterized NAD(P)/FAD-binding protein YdhS
VAVVGAGFSGVLTAAHLLRDPLGPRVVLIERGPRFARGAAYATGNPRHLLNVRGSNMSAFPEAPSHFLDWLGVSLAEGERAFVTRQRYGEYLQSLLGEAARGSAGRLTFEHDAATAVARTSGGWAISLAMGRRIRADAAVLAIGNLPPPVPDGVAAEVISSPRWIAEPWAQGEERRWEQGDVLLIGSGLTAMDVALTIADHAPGARVTALSRHGLAPQAHAPTGLAQYPVSPPPGSVLHVLREVRRAARHDWRAAADGLRPYVQSLWRSWDLPQRRRFLRHLRPFWEVARHRLAPEAHARLEELRTRGLLEIAAGRLQSLRLVAGGLEAVWSPRGEREAHRRRFAMAVNCVGPLSDVARSDDPLVCELLRSGLARSDACRLGMDVDDESRPLGRDGRPSDGLFAVGPLTRGQIYEMTSVPDIRIQAAAVARAVLAGVVRPDPALAPGGGQGVDRVVGELRTWISEQSAELDREIESKVSSRRVRSAWELRGRKSALDEVAAWLEAREPDA